MARRILAVLLCPALIGILVMSLAPQPLRADLNNYVQTNLVSDIPGLAANTDPNLVNPWGIAFGPTSPFWISDNHTGLSTLYRGAYWGIVSAAPARVTRCARRSAAAR